MGNLIGGQGLSLSSYFDPSRVDECGQKKGCPVVTVSRTVGANGSKIAELLAKNLGVPCFGYSMLDGIVKEAKTDKFLMQLIDERAPNPLEDWIHALFSDGKASKMAFYRRLIKTTLAIAKAGGVIIGRGAHLILANNPKVFRVRIEGSPKVCAQRIADRDNISVKEAKEFIQKTDKERKNYVEELYKRYPHERTYYDLVINSDTGSLQDSVDIILYAMQKMGKAMPAKG